MSESPWANLHTVVEKQIREAHEDGYRIGLGAAIGCIEATKRALRQEGMPDDWTGFGALDGLAQALREASASYRQEDQ